MSHETSITTEIDPYQLLSRFHQVGVGGLFTETHTVSEGLILGLSHLTKASVWNTGLLGGQPSDSQFEQTENILRIHNGVPSFYAVNGSLHVYLSDRGYEISWSDSWMKLAEPRNLIKVEPTVGFVTNVETDYDLDKCLDVLLLRGWQKEDGPEDPYGEMSPDELEAQEVVLRRLVQSGRGQCFVAWEGSGPSAEPVATATVSFLEEIAYVANLVTVPDARHRGFGRMALMAAIRTGYASAQKIATLKEVEPIICLATESGQDPQAIFEHVGFEEMFTAHGYTHAIQ
jgi:hypothetical protein